MNFEKRQRFAIRKFSVGVASVLVGQFFVGAVMNAPQVRASEVKKTEEFEVKKLEESLIDQSSKDVAIPEPYQAPATLAGVSEEKVEDNATVTAADEKTSDKIIESKENSQVTPSEETPENLQSLKEQLNNSVIEAKAVNQEIEKQVTNDSVDREDKKKLNDVLQTSKTEIELAEKLSAKDFALKSELKYSLVRMQAAIELGYSELKRSGHSGQVVYMLSEESKTTENTNPYMTIENYSGIQSLRQNGAKVQLRYKMGLTRITSDEVELSQGAKDLGLTYDPEGEYVYGELTLDGRIQSGIYQVGLVSKTNPAVSATLPLEITKPKSYGLTTLGNYRGDLSASKSSDWRAATGDMGEDNTQINSYIIPTTPFGYYLDIDDPDTKTGTIADATPTTPTYYTELGLYVADSASKNDFPTKPILLERIERLDTTPDVDYELVTVGDVYGGNDYGWNVHGNATPYRLRFTKLPATQGTFTIKFKTVDALGQERIFNVQLTTEERSKATNDNNGSYLTNADVRFAPNKELTVLNREGIVSVPRSTEEQNLGKIEINKVNASIKPVRLPDGLEFDSATQTIKKKAGAKLAPGKYSFEFRAIDGHFGDNAPNRIFQFEVTDVLEPISHQVWQEEKKFSGVPVTLSGNSAIAAIRVVTESGDTYASISGDSVTKTLEGYGVKKTPVTQTARLEVDYYNTEGGISTTFTTFTFEVKPREGVALNLDVTNSDQTVKEGEIFKDIVISHTDGARLTVDTNALPKGTKYDPETKTVSGRALVEGNYRVKVLVEKDGQAVQKYINLKVLPGALVAEDYSRELTAGETIDPIEFPLPKNATISIDFYNRLGLKLDYEKRVISGVANIAGTETFTYNLRRGREEVIGSVTIKVKPKPVEVKSGERTVEVGKPIENFVLSSSEGAVVGSPSTSGWIYKQNLYGLPEGLSFDPNTNTISGTPKIVGEFTISYNVGYENISSETPRGMFKVIVTSKPIQVTGGERTVQVLSEMPPIKLEASEGAKISYYGSLPNGVTYDSSTQTFSGIPTEVGTYRINVQASYPDIMGNKTANSEVIIKVTESPVSIAISNKDQTVAIGDEITPAVISHNNLSTVGMKTPYGIVEEEEINNVLSDYGLTYNAATKTITGSPTKTGVIKIRMQAQNPTQIGGAAKIDTLTLTVTPKVEKELDLTVLGGRQLITLGKSLSDITITHTAGTVLTIDEANLPSGVTYNAVTKTISGVPTVAGSYTVKATATIAEKSVSKDILIDVIDIRNGQDGRNGVDGQNGRDGVNGQDGKSPTITVVDNGNGTHTLHVVNPDGQTANTLIKNGQDGRNGLDGQNGRDGVNGQDGKSPTITVVDNGDGTHTLQVVNPDGQTANTLIKNGKDGRDGVDGQNGKDGKSSTIVTEFGQDSEGQSGVWLIVRDSDGNITSRNFISNGKDGKTPKVLTETGKDKDGNSGVWVVTYDGDGQEVSRTFVQNGKDGQSGQDGKSSTVITEIGKNEDGYTGVWVIVRDSDGRITSRTFIRDGKDGKTPSVLTESGKNKDGQTGYWVIIKDGDGKELNRLFIRDCGCPKEKTPQPTPQPSPQPSPQPTPQPTPQPNPQPSPQPSPQPTPQPNPQPNPKPDMELVPQPIEDKFIPLSKFNNDSDLKRELPKTGSEDLPFLPLLALTGLATASYALSRKRDEKI